MRLIAFCLIATSLNAETPQFKEGVAIEISTTEIDDSRILVNGRTNLPAGTSLIISVEEKLQGGFSGSTSATVNKGSFTAGPFGPKAGLEPGEYIIDVTMPLPFLQTKSVQKTIGENGENLKGPLVERDSYGVIVTKSAMILIGGDEAKSKQAERDAKNKEDIQNLKIRLKSLLSELLEFKNKEDFKNFGFSIGGPYNSWLKSVESLIDEQPRGEHYIPLQLRAATIDLQLLGLEYMQKGDTKTAAFLLSEIENAILP